MITLLNYVNEKCFLTEEQEKHIFSRHPELTLEIISLCLSSPDEIRKSNSNKICNLYYNYKCEQRFYCVVLKVCTDGNFISTAYTTNKIKNGELIYKKEH